MMGANILIEKLVRGGACDGLDKERCVQAIAKLLKLGEKGVPVVKTLLGRDFNEFRVSYRAAYEKVVNGEESKTSAWNEITSDVVD